MGFEKIDLRYVEIGDVMTGRMVYPTNREGIVVTGPVVEIHPHPNWPNTVKVDSEKRGKWWINEIDDGET